MRIDIVIISFLGGNVEKLYKVGGILVLALLVMLILSIRQGEAQTVASIERRIFQLEGDWIRSSVALGDLTGDGIPEIVVGGLDGVLHAYRGNGQRLWRYDTGSATIEGKPAIGDINGDGRNEVVVGLGGTLSSGAPGAVVALSNSGGGIWRYESDKDFNNDGVPDGVYSSPTLVDVNGDGKLEIVYGGYDARIRMLNYNGTLRWEYFTRDTMWSSPAVGDINGDGEINLVIGSDSHYESDFGTIDGGKAYAMNADDGTVLPGFPIHIDETVWSSPALADLTGDGYLDIVVGTGHCWENPNCAVPKGNTHPTTKAIYAWNRYGQPLPGWPVILQEATMSSPTITDLTGDGNLEVIINTHDAYLHVLKADGTHLSGWPQLVTTPAGEDRVVHVPTGASPIVADLTGDGGLEIILPSNWEIVVWDRWGNQLTRHQFPSPKWDLSTSYTIADTPAVGDVTGDGYLNLISGGALSGGSPGAIYIWDFPVSAAKGVFGVDFSPWPTFRRDVHNSARYGALSGLSGLPDQIYLLVEQSPSSTVEHSMLIKALGEHEIYWEAIPPDGVTVVPDRGNLAVGASASIEVTISTTGCQVGTPCPKGDLIINAEIDAGALPGSPFEIPITLHLVENLYQTYLPLIAR